MRSKNMVGNLRGLGGTGRRIPMGGDSSIFNALQRDNVLELLVQCIAQLPLTPKTVLAMYYHENLELAEIAACLDLTECETEQIRAETVGLLQTMFVRGWLEVREGRSDLPAKPPRNWLADMVSIGVLILTATGILVISDALQKKGVTSKLDPTELNVQNVRQDTVAVESRPTNPEPALRSISDDPSSPPTQSTVIGGLPESPFEPSATGKTAPRHLGTESDVRGLHFHRQFSDVDQKLGPPQENKRKWPKALILYLEAHQDYLRRILRHAETASPKTRQ